MRDLLERVLGATGKDEARIHEILLRGSLVAGASRFRWSGWEPDLAGIRALLATFPDPDPSRPFAAERCMRAILRGGHQAVEVPREAARHKRPFHNDSFWDFMMEVTAAAQMHYGGDSYRDRADRYIRDFTAAEVDQIRAGSSRVKYSTLREQILRSAFQQAELVVVRSVVTEP